MVRFFLFAGIVLTTLAIPHGASSNIEVLDEIVAGVNSTIITRSELDENIRIFRLLKIKQGVPVSQRQLQIIVLFKMIDDYLLQKEGGKLAITASSEDVQRALENLQGEKSYETFTEELQQAEITLGALKGQLRRELLADRVIQWKARGLRPDINLKDTQVKEFFQVLKQYLKGMEQENGDVAQFYSLYREQLLEEEKVWLGQIVVETEEQAERIIQYLAEGEDFASLATQFSLGPNAQKEGDLGWFNMNQIQDSLRALINTLKEGEVTAPVPVNGQFYRILQVKERRELSFQEWEEKIKGYFFNREMIHRLDTWVKSLREKGFVQIMDVDLKKEWND